MYILLGAIVLVVVFIFTKYSSWDFIRNNYSEWGYRNKDIQEAQRKK